MGDRFVMKICLITGTSSGIGFATAVHLARNGYKVYATMRSVEKSGELLKAVESEGLPLEVKRLDVSKADSIKECLDQIFDVDGHIDVLINNAGLSNSCPIENYPEKEHRELFEANYWGPVKLTQNVLPKMRERAGGMVINVSSLLGKIAWANQAAYCASKHAIEAFSESLAQEVAPFGIQVAIIQPGVTASAIFENTPVHYDKFSPYKPAMRRNGRFYSVGIANSAPATEIAELILHALTTEQPVLRYAAGYGSQAIRLRTMMTDENFIALGEMDDSDYYDQLKKSLDIDLTQQT